MEDGLEESKTGSRETRYEVVALSRKEITVAKNKP